MSQSVIDLNNLPAIANPGRIAILKSKWYPELTDEMANVAEKVLRENGYRLVEVHTLPGSLELPLAASDLLSSDVGGEIDAIICFGVIVKGDTLHFEMITHRILQL